MSLDPDAFDAGLAARGDAEAFRRLYVRHAGRIQTLARRFLGPADASDGAQEVFVRAWTRLEQFRGEAAFGTWLHRLAVNVLLRQAERTTRWTAGRTPLDPELAEAPAGHPALRARLDRALASLGPGLREVVVLHDMESYTHEDIAAALGITVSASKMRLHRGRSALRAFLGGKDR
ncbi:MAG TPA: sigma-70 family RNA polymerase sigma factor [Longimicrobium sp.]|nr:sigma-70 family RNA polymerase sigma factor [Longimicrobium sp.]